MRECGRCQWWEHCRPQLDAQRRQPAHRQGSAGHAGDRHAAPPRDRARSPTWPAPTWTSCSPGICRKSPTGAAPRAGSGPPPAGPGCCWTAARSRGRPTGRSRCPSADIEIDFDIESVGERPDLPVGIPGPAAAAPDRASTTSSAASPISTTPLRPRWPSRRSTGCGAWSRRGGLGGGLPLQRLRGGQDQSAGRPREHDPLLDWAAGYAEEQFVDLLEIVKTHYFGVAGLGLKLIAKHAGFSWRDDDPGGLNSQVWFAEAVHGEDARAGRGAAAGAGVQRGRRHRHQPAQSVAASPVIAASSVRRWLRSITASTSSMPPRRLGKRPASARRRPDPRVAAANPGCQRGEVRVGAGCRTSARTRADGPAGRVPGWRRCCRRRRWRPPAADRATARQSGRSDRSGRAGRSGHPAVRGSAARRPARSPTAVEMLPSIPASPRLA